MNRIFILGLMIFFLAGTVLGPLGCATDPQSGASKQQESEKKSEGSDGY